MTLVQLLPTLSPVVVAVIGLIGAVALYGHQRRLERAEDLRKARRQVYREFVSIIPLLKGGDRELNEKYQAYKSEIILYGSDNTVRCLKSFASLIEVGGPNYTLDSTARLNGYGSMISSMRKDVFPETELTGQDLSQLSPFGT